jgi:hypothetical protein
MGAARFSHQASNQKRRRSKHPQTQATNMIDLKGQTFSRLTVKKRVMPTPAQLLKSRSVLWDCLCECGNSITVVSPQLLRGQTKSCGCLRKEMARDKRKGRTLGRPQAKPQVGKAKKKEISLEDLF